MKILFSTIHSIDIDNNRIILREKENDIDDALSSILVRMNSEDALRDYEEESVNTTVVKHVLSIANAFSTKNITDDRFSELNHDIAIKLLSVEVEVEESNMKTHKKSVQRGTLVQALVFREESGKLEYYIAKLEHNEFYSEENFVRLIGFQSDKAKVYKSCKFKIDISETTPFIITAEVYVNNASKYWTDRFLELKEVNTDTVNTRKAFNSIDTTLTKILKTNYKADFQIIRNAFIGYLRTSRRDIEYSTMINEILDGYEGIKVPEQIITIFKEELMQLPKKAGFDPHFTAEPKAVKGRKYTTYKVNVGVELVLNKDGKIEDLENTISSVVEHGERYIKIKTNDIETFESFIRNIE